MKLLLKIILLLGGLSAQAQYRSYADIQNQVNQAFGGSNDNRYQQRPQFQHYGQPEREVRCITRERPGFGGFNGPEYETFCN